MKFHLAALLLGLCAAQPAWAQTDKYDSGDWWWLDTRGDGIIEAAFLANGEGVRKGDKVELDMVMIFREPDENGAIGARIREVINCKAKTRANGLTTMLFADGRAVEMRDTGFAERGALDPETTIYLFACKGDRSRGRHFGKGSRREVTEALFAEYPGE